MHRYYKYYYSYMAALQIKNFPDDLLRDLKIAAAIQQQTLTEYVTVALRDAVATVARARARRFAAK